jgi:hypothetical protein
MEPIASEEHVCKTHPSPLFLIVLQGAIITRKNNWEQSPWIQRYAEWGAFSLCTAGLDVPWRNFFPGGGFNELTALAVSPSNR